MIRVAIDAMGSDQAPGPEVDGAALALRELPPEFELILVGRPDAIEPLLARHADVDRSRLRVVGASDVVTMSDKPLAAIRRKPDSSLVVALNLHKAGEADAMISAGNTGATLAGATVLLGLHDGVDRAAVASPLPTPDGIVLVLDAGANVDCSARELVNFARLGTLYMRDLVGIAEPKVGLLNVGEEDEKGGAVLREAHQLLKSQPRIRYVGNIEGRDVVVPHPRHGNLDVVVCDGYVGNAILKFYESMGTLLGLLIRKESPALLKSPDMVPLTRFLDTSQYGGAPLLGVKGVAIIEHGATSPATIRNAIRMAVRAVRQGLSDHTAAEMSQRVASVGA